MENCGKKQQIKFVFFFLCFVAISECQNVPKTSQRYTVNLDLPAGQRWGHVLKEHKGSVIVMHNMLKHYLPEWTAELVEKVAAGLDSFLPEPYASEIRGMAEAVDINLGDLVIANIVYDITAFCTSTVAQDSSGHIWHARNLDYGFAESLKNITIMVDFTRGGKVVYSSTTYAGYVGILTGQKPHAFTVSLDERRQGNIYVIENILMLLLDYKHGLMSFYIRDVFETTANFTEAVKALATRPSVAPSYVIIGGVLPGEGAVITRGRLGAEDVWFLDPKVGRWFVLETNYDHWKVPPKDDDRRDPGNKAMQQMGRTNITVQALFKVMSTKPVLNKGTTFTTIMSADRPDIYTTLVRWDMH
ncbi:unnamed protein product [Owenia fusiformis]|uniref:N-acylethanolamine-hydrolyzing acid amidase n=1 Tax=Owenia fusiformis TaxID=6347 RepID=A0A8S4PZK0_OWEFU|nr:unnamed protein product [Owenia fusiformis]